MSRNSFYFFIFSLVPACLFFFRPIATGDLSIWTALGIDSIDNLKIIVNDTYTVSLTTSMVYPVFISLIYGVLHKVGGIALVAAIHGFVPTVWLYYWFRFINKNFWNYKVFIVFVSALLGGAFIFTARPALIATIPLIISYYLIAKWKDKLYSKWDVFYLILIEVVWVNLHGSFLLLPLMLIWQIPFFVQQKKIKLAVNRIATSSFILLSTIANPFTWHVIPYTWETAIISKARGLDEWYPPHYFYYPFASWYFYLISALILLIIFIKYRNFTKFLDIFSNPFFMFCLSGFFAVRNTFFIFLVLPIFVFDKLISPQARIDYKNNPSSKILNFTVITLLMVSCLLLSPFIKKEISVYLPENYQTIYDRNARVNTIFSYLNINTGNIFNSWQYGSDLALEQKNKYFVDTRNIIFSDLVTHEYELFINQPSINSDILTKYQFKYFLINKEHTRLLKWLQSRPEFKLILEEYPAYLFEKI